MSSSTEKLHIPDDVNTLSDIVEFGANLFEEAGLFFGHGTDNASDEALALAMFALGLSYDMPGDVLAQNLSEQDKTAIAELFNSRLQRRVPAAYLTHEAWFAGHRFYVDERVLVPRSPIAEIINDEFVPWVNPDKVKNILDLCTGGGCIAIACAYAFPDASVDAIELVEDALDVARLNVEQHKLGERVHLYHSDLFQNLEAKRYDIIVSNPPYVDLDSMLSLPDEYTHEPEIGLAAGQDGLDIVRRILAEAGDYLTEDGILVVEVGLSQERLEQVYKNIPFFWFEFEHGGEGVFLLTAEQLRSYANEFTKLSPGDE